MNIAQIGHVHKVMTALNRAGHQAYIVGGALRDMLLGRVPNDYDIATDARVEELVVLAERQGWKIVDRLGQNFGVVMVVVDNCSLEIAAFRGERYGLDSHRPSDVWYAETIEEDLARRDFTVNAMAMDAYGTVIDPFGGQADLEKRVLRTVGKAEARFAEDALRMFRACRFAAQLGFVIEEATFAAIRPNLGRVEGLSLERVRTELERMLTAEWPERGLDALVCSGLAGASCRVKEAGEYITVPILPELEHLVNLPQNPQYHSYDAWRHTLAVVAGVPIDAVLRWAALLHDVGKGLPGVRAMKDDGQPSDHGHEKVGAELAERILTRLRFSLPFSKRVKWLVSQHMQFGFLRAASRIALTAWVRREARSRAFRSNAELVEAFCQLGALGLADIRGTGKGVQLEQAAQFAERLCEIASTMPVCTADLNYESDELLSALTDRRYMGPFLRVVLQRVQDGQLINTPETIRNAAERWINRRKYT